MHIYFSGIGGSGMSSFALLAKQAGFHVSGSDKQESPTVQSLRAHGIPDISTQQTYDSIAATHAKNPIDWLVYTSALTMEQPDSPEIAFCRDNNIRTSKRDDFLNMLLQKKQQKMVAFAGTHGKSTATAMAVWLCKQLGLPISYSLGAKISFGETGVFNPDADYFVYECDEFDRNFLAYQPFVSAITGLAWDHHEIFPSLQNYNQAFRDFIGQSTTTIAWRGDLEKLSLAASPTITALDQSDPAIDTVKLAGRFNREDAWLVMHAVSTMTGKKIDELQPHMDAFPGLRQRMEQLAPNLFTNYAHTPEKILGGMSTAKEIAAGKNLVIIYEPLTNRRQHYIKDLYKDTFAGAAKLYWVPTLLAREDAAQPILTPEQLISHLTNAEIAEPARLNDALKTAIQAHLSQGDVVVAMDASGPGSLDEWLRKEFGTKEG